MSKKLVTLAVVFATSLVATISALAQEGSVPALGQQPGPNAAQPPVGLGPNQPGICAEKLLKTDPEEYARSCGQEPIPGDGEPGEDGGQPGAPGTDLKEETGGAFPETARPANPKGEDPFASQGDPGTVGATPQGETWPEAGTADTKADPSGSIGTDEAFGSGETTPEEVASGEGATGKRAAGRGAVRKGGTGNGGAVRKGEARRNARKGAASRGEARRAARKDATRKRDARKSTVAEATTGDEATTNEATTGEEATGGEAESDAAATPANSRVPLLLGGGALAVVGGGLLAYRVIR